MLCNGVFGYVTFIGAFVCMTSRDAKTVRRTSWGWDTSDRYVDQEHETNQKSLRLPVFKSYGSNSGFHVFGCLVFGYQRQI